MSTRNKRPSQNRRQRRGDIERDIDRRYKRPTEYSSLTRDQRIALELEEFKRKQYTQRHIEQNRNRRAAAVRNRLASEAFERVEDAVSKLAELQREPDMPDVGTRAYKQLMQQEKKMQAIADEKNAEARRPTASAFFARRNRQRYEDYMHKADQIIENVAIKVIKTLLRDKHLEALRGHENLEQVRPLIVAIMEQALQEEDDEDKIECTFCQYVSASDRLRKEHTKTKHFPKFIEKALAILQLQ